MSYPDNEDQLPRTVLRQLLDNEQECLRHNIVVRVESISKSRHVALCTVEQCLRGLFRRRRSSEELLWQAEQALAPLFTLGLSPYITVHDRRPGQARKSPLKITSAKAIWRWMGYPFARRGYGHRLLLRDPFGWRKAMAAAEGAPWALPKTALP